MKTRFLFPNKYKLIGWILLIPTFVLGCMIIFAGFEFDFLNVNVLSLFPSNFSNAWQLFSDKPAPIFKIAENNITDELVAVLFIIAAFLVAFSRETDEDEFISKVRLESLVWAIFFSFGIQLFSLIFFHEFTFLISMIVNMFTVLIVFIIRFNYLLFKFKHQNNEK